LQALAFSDAASPAQRCELLLALGDARFHAGDVPRARGTMLEAAAVARQMNDAVRLARAATGVWNVGGGWYKAGQLDEEAMALAALPASEGVLRAQVLTTRVLVLIRSAVVPLIEQAIPVSREAVDSARSTGDLESLLAALSVRFLALEASDAHEERYAVLAEW